MGTRVCWAFFCVNPFWTLWCYVGVLPSCIFPSLVNNIHIISLASIVPFSFEHFFFSWFLWGLWSSLATDWFNHFLVYLLVFFLPLILFPFGWHQGFEHPIWICFLFLFAKHTRWKCSCKCVFKVNACRNNFWDPLSMFCPKTFLFFSITNLLTLVYFFWCDFHVSFLDCPQPPLMHCQTFLPISCGGINLISIKFILPMAYLMSWALVAPIITTKFLSILAHF